jgi:MATE family multidrug resistance protein
MIATTIPLLVGAFLEYGEWEILLFFVVNLGPAEVATWALVGIIWKLLETSTEGFGEAAAIRVAYHLGSGSAQLARLASHKALLISTLQSLFITSILLMAGKNIANILVPDPTLQELLNNLIINVSLGNIVMSFAMSVWSLLGAQGRYRLATLVILICRWIITIPMALTCVFLFDYDLNSVMGSVTTGFATSVLALSYIFFRSDWERLSRIMQELNAMMELHSDFEDSSDDDDDDSEVGEPSFEGVTTIDNDDSVAANELPSSWVASPRNAATVAHLTTLS